MSTPSAAQASLIEQVEQVEQIAAGLARTFAPSCEVVVHGLRAPWHAVLAIHDNLSGRAMEIAAAHLGISRATAYNDINKP